MALFEWSQAASMHKTMLIAMALGCSVLTSAFVPSSVVFRHASGARGMVVGRHKNLALRNSVLGLKAADNSALVSWLEENGVKNSCTLTPEGLQASSDLKNGAEACSSSPKVYLTEATAKEALGSKIDELDTETAIALQLLLEKSKGSESFWAPWIATLPEADAFDVPFFWSADEKKFLEGTTVATEVEELEDALRDEFQQLQTAGWGEKFPDGSFTFENYAWAVCTTSARSVTFEKFPGKTLVAPLIDNALTSAPGSAKVGLGFEGMFREPRIKVTVSQTSQSGSMVGVDFDGKSTSKLLFRHGVAKEGGAGEVEATFAVSPLDRFADDKFDILELNGYEAEQSFVLRSDSPPPEAMMAFMRLVCIKAQDAFLLESVFRNDAWGFMLDPVSPENEELALDTLIATFEGALEELLDAPPIPGGAGASKRAKLAQAVRESEMKALRAAIVFLEQDKKTLDEKEYYQERRLRSLNLDRPVDDSEIVDPDIDFRRENVPWN
eukprot:CAMPEP_0177706342 /NCGR_PEP_ID=MMETSP0484_2-20121128/9175_1 /TAXON_ID=354590 /ORGANISM="Rhodomonas lens, Strain RHODO" /LENGTH=497 /DNA_ID=CAMNT_0019217799 /DNA_START=8 /DNA_END=1501 /DNA_ORIENTATION=+